MIDQAHAVHTQVNNVVGTLNLLWAIAETDPTIHLVKLGTMGEYGTPNIDIEEGWLDVTHNGRTDRPALPEAARARSTTCRRSTTATTSCSAAGPGGCGPPISTRASSTAAETDETGARPGLATRFDYDAVFGTVLNRFIVQAVARAPPDRLRHRRPDPRLPEHRRHRALPGAGRRPPRRAGEFRVFNQFTESFSVLELAELVAALYEGHVRIEYLDNPRVEKDQHYYRAAHDGLTASGSRTAPALRRPWSNRRSRPCSGTGTGSILG